MNAPTLRWHLPTFAAWQCASGAMSDRERLGLPDRFHQTDLQHAVEAATTLLSGMPADLLLALLADGSVPLAERIAAGNFLALAGDPRLDPLRPVMTDIPGGPIWIGLEAGAIDAMTAGLSHLGIDRGWIAKEAPRHCLTLAPYRMARYPVTNGEYRHFLRDTGHPEIPSSWTFRRYPVERANHPVYTVSANAADAYAAWLSVQTGRGFRQYRRMRIARYLARWRVYRRGIVVWPVGHGRECRGICRRCLCALSRRRPRQRPPGPDPRHLSHRARWWLFALCRFGADAAAPWP